MGLLTGKIALITGIGPGMGRDLALAFSREGAKLAITCRTKERLESVAKEVRQRGGVVLAVEGGIGDEAGCRRFVEAAIGEYGRVDSLVNNAFVQPPFEQLDVQSVDVVIDSFQVNLFAAMRLAQLVVPGMRAQNGGTIVNINSSVMQKPLPTMGAYKMAKHALFALTQQLACEFGPDGVRVNTVSPWYIQGKSVEDYFEYQGAQTGTSGAAIKKTFTDQAALRRLPGSDEISNVAVFFASELSSAVTGQEMAVNCGAYYQ
jgi:NAD(P)-dependent dehydrogenase (short-subunit alcohol dehydrogenase family)